MRVKTYLLVGGGAADAVNFAAAQAPTANTPLTLAAGATAASLVAQPREVTLTSAADLSAITFTIVGLDRWGGNVITEQIVGPNANTVTGRKIYQRITSITPSATSGSNVSAGYPQRVVSPWVVADVNRSTEQVPLMQLASEIVSGAPDLSVENTYEWVTNVSGDGAYVQSSQDTTPPSVTTVQGTAVRGVCTTATGSIRIRVPRFGAIG